MSSTTVLSAMVITCLVIVVLVALAKPLQGLFRFLLSGILGSALLFLLGRLGFAVGVNAVTFVVTGLLGMPGVAGLVVLGHFLWENVGFCKLLSRRNGRKIIGAN